MLAGLAADISQQVLRTDVAGMPLEWIDYREAVRLYHAEQVAYDCGTRLYSVFGGYSSVDGSRSRIDVNSIIATHGDTRALAELILEDGYRTLDLTGFGHGRLQRQLVLVDHVRVRVDAELADALLPPAPAVALDLAVLPLEQDLTRTVDHRHLVLRRDLAQPPGLERSVVDEDAATEARRRERDEAAALAKHQAAQQAGGEESGEGGRD